jgi:hypothetical protein
MSPVLSNRDVEELKHLYEGLRVCARTAKELGVRIMIDAEYTWWQPM